LQNEGDKTLVNWLEQLQETLEPLVRLTSLKSVPFDEILTKHIKVAEKLACTDSQEGADRFYSGAAGEQLKEFLDDLMLPAKNFKAINPIEYSALLDALFVGQVYRSPYGTHPRISILSPIEARMQNFDLVIMGALNEGSWPEGVKSDPWMSRPMRSNFGLPLPEKRIGQSAHDFAQIFCSGQVIMTRSEKMDGTQTIPSRWLLRLSAILKILKAEDAIKSKQPWNKWAELLSKPEVIKACVIPEPKPSVELRPKKLSVTNIEKLMRDPYAIYASKILGLKALDPIDKDPGPAEFGNFVHKALEMFVKGWESGIWNLESRSNLDSRFQILDSLLNCGHEILKQQDLKPAIISFWWPRFERIAKWFAENEPQRREGKLKILSEVSGEYKIGEFTLYARADRIEIDNDGNIAIIDYKTGTVPTQKDIELGFSPQMTLEGLIASKGGFSTNLDSRSQIPDSPISELSHWKLSGSEEAVKGEPVKGQIAELITEAEAGVNQLINIFTNVNTPYLPCPNPDKALGYNDYEHLERVKEWMD
jgi:ATP-dependent helicase/nuclease subunit B